MLEHKVSTLCGDPRLVRTIPAAESLIDNLYSSDTRTHRFMVKALEFNKLLEV